jgi:hypothetical protein
MLILRADIVLDQCHHHLPPVGQVSGVSLGSQLTQAGVQGMVVEGCSVFHDVLRWSGI